MNIKFITISIVTGLALSIGSGVAFAAQDDSDDDTRIHRIAGGRGGGLVWRAPRTHEPYALTGDSDKMAPAKVHSTRGRSGYRHLPTPSK